MGNPFKYTIIFIFLIQFQSGWTNDISGTLYGTVVDADTHEPLPGTNVFVEHTTIGTATDKDGKYIIYRVPAGRLHIVASMMGYQREHKIVEVSPDQKICVDFELHSTILELGAVVVTGTSTPHLVEDMPVRTEVIPRRTIEQRQACNLAEALSFQTGIRVENNCQNCNFTQVRILGMDGKYSQILIDGDPVVSSLAGVYGLEHFPEEMVDQIEIVKGGGSALYGGGAVAGVINMITRRPMMKQVRLKYLGHIIGGKADQHVGVVAETVNETGSSGAYIFGSFRKRNPYDHNDDGFSEMGELLNESIGLKWYLNPFQNSEFLVSFHRIHEERRGGNKFDRPVHEADISEWTEHWRSGGTLRWSHRLTPLFDYRAYYSFSMEKRKSYYGGLRGDSDGERLEALKFYGKTDNPLMIAGLQMNYRLGGHLLTAGLQHKRDKVKDETASDTAYHLDVDYVNSGLFLQDDIHFGPEEEIELVFGLRLDKHSELTDWIMSPRVNSKLQIANGLALRAAYTTGFKPPQTYDEDLHLCGLEGDQRIIRNSPDLKEEKSHSLSGGIEYHGFIDAVPIMVSLTVFNARLENSFTERFIEKRGHIERWERVNSDGASVKGIELDLGIQPIDAVEIRGGLTYKRSRYDNLHEDFHTRNFLRTPDMTGNVRCILSLTERLELLFNGQYVGRADVPHEIVVEEEDEPELRLERSDRFFQLDLGLTYMIPLKNGLSTKFNMGVKNLTNAYQKDLDTGPDRDPAYIYGPIRPRTFYAGLRGEF